MNITISFDFVMLVNFLLQNRYMSAVVLDGVEIRISAELFG